MSRSAFWEPRDARPPGPSTSGKSLLHADFFRFRRFGGGRTKGGAPFRPPGAAAHPSRSRLRVGEIGNFQAFQVVPKFRRGLFGICHAIPAGFGPAADDDRVEPALRGHFFTEIHGMRRYRPSDGTPAHRRGARYHLSRCKLGKAPLHAATATAEFKTALGNATLADEASDKAFAEEVAARTAVREQLESAYGRLRDLYKSRPMLAEGFFLKDNGSRRTPKKPPEGGGGGGTPPPV
jgi:hypothetical protein